MAVKVAIVHDALPFYGGAERTLQEMLAVFPGAPVFTLLHVPDAFAGTPLHGADIRPSWLNRLPGVHRSHYRYFPLFPFAVRSLDLREYDLVISSHYAVAHWVRLRPGQVHAAYVYTPLRYLWQDAAAFRRKLPFWLRPAAAAGQAVLRTADRRAAGRVQRMAVISQHIAGVAARAYRRDAQVLYPPVDVERFAPGAGRREGFVCISRLARHKKLEVVITAFNRLGLPLEVIGDGPERARLEALAGPTVHFSGHLEDAEAAARLGNAEAFIHMAAEDFGIAVVEAQAAGCPVIAYRGGANKETVIDGVTGLLVPEQTPEALAATVRRFVSEKHGFAEAALRGNALRFSGERFRAEFHAFALAG